MNGTIGDTRLGIIMGALTSKVYAFQYRNWELLFRQYY
jgi:hypothetical protein